MSKKKKAKGRNASPIKIGLIAVLSLVMLAVWGNALLGGKSTTPLARRDTSRAAAKLPSDAGPARSTPRVAVAGDREADADWPEVPVSKAARNDPFARPSWALSPEPDADVLDASFATSAAALENLEAAQASMIVIAGSAKIATVGGQEFRVGDIVQGYEVIDITSRGVVFADAETQN